MQRFHIKQVGFEECRRKHPATDLGMNFRHNGKQGSKGRTVRGSRKLKSGRDGGVKVMAGVL